MWYAIGAIVLFNLLVFAFIYGAGKANKAWDEAMEKEFGPGDIIEQGRSQIKKNKDAMNMLVWPVWISKWIKKVWGKSYRYRPPILYLYKQRVQLVLRNRILELNIADRQACEKRWDMSRSPAERRIWREQSNEITFARQELERILKALKALNDENC